MALALMFRVDLAAWFTGWQPERRDQQPATQNGPAAPVAPDPYDQATDDALLAAADAYEHIRAALARDELTGVEAASHTMEKALTAASQTAAVDTRPTLIDAARFSGQVASSRELDTARSDFAALSAQLLPLLGRDTRLTKGKYVFECPMFQHATWFQPAPTIDNPYMGSSMRQCGSAIDWPGARQQSLASATQHDDDIDHYTCSMHPSVNQRDPGRCPICGMDLIAVTDQQQRKGVVIIDEARRQLIGVRTGRVIEGPMKRDLHVVGKVAYDEAALTDVNLKVSGWISKLLVSQTGQRVTRGQTLFTLYSPDLYAAQQDFLLAIQGTKETAGGQERSQLLVRAARKRLSLLGLGETQIDQIATGTEPIDSIPITSPATGFVIEKEVVEGASVQAGTRLLRIAALDKVWIEGDVYENDLRAVRVGQAARVSLDYLSGRSYAGKVAFVYPYLAPEARTGRVRIELENKDLELKPGMYARVALSADSGVKLQVPVAALVYTGPRRLVFVDLGDGRFRPQEIKIGIESNGMVEVLEGLKAGDAIATSGMFLIAAEARISTATKYWESESTSPADAVSGAHE